MTAPRHTVLRQVIEITVRSEAEARWVHADVGRLCRDRLWPALERELAARNDADTLLRLDSVEVNLGRLPVEGFAEAAATRFQEGVGPSLTRSIRAAESAAGGPRDARIASQVELLSHFADTGTLPWWADSSQPDLIGQTVRRLAREAPNRLLAWFRRRADDPASLRRLVAVCPDDALAGAFEALRPEAADGLRRLIKALVGLAGSNSGLAGSPPRRVRQAAWECALATAAARGAEVNDSDVVRQFLQRFSAALEVSETDVASALAQQRGNDAAQADRERERWLAAILSPRAASASPAADDLDAAAALKGGGTSWAGFWRTLRPFVSGFPEPLRAELSAILRTTGRSAGGHWPAPDFERWLWAALASRVLPRRVLGDWLNREADAESPTHHPSVMTAALRASVRTVFAEASPADKSNELDPSGEATESDFSQADALYVDNAGVVVLWPFLESFLNHLGLVAAKQFKSDAARHRAAGLLQYLATADRDPLEYHLPLNKVLCGMEAEDPFEFGEPVSDAEQAECDRLLAAVIEQAPILQRMSVGGFRNTFLRRRGQLSARDGAGLLRVERETYDVVLDRFPWPLQWVRLPWMSALLQVEW